MSATATSRHSLSPLVLRNFVEKAAQATLAGDAFDDAVTGQGHPNFFVRGSSGALTLEEAKETGLSVEELQARSFMKILKSRRLDYGRLMRIIVPLLSRSRSWLAAAP